MDIVWYEAVWDTDEEGNVVWTLYILQHPPLPSYPAPDRQHHDDYRSSG